jgi:hypothetical protein
VVIGRGCLCGNGFAELFIKASALHAIKSFLEGPVIWEQHGVFGKIDAAAVHGDQVNRKCGQEFISFVAGKL